MIWRAVIAQHIFCEHAKDIAAPETALFNVDAAMVCAGMVNTHTGFYAIVLSQTPTYLMNAMRHAVAVAAPRTLRDLKSLRDSAGM